MEIKAEADIADAKRERMMIEAAFSDWLTWRSQSEADQPTPAQAFMAGWIEHKEKIRRIQLMMGASKHE